MRSMKGTACALAVILLYSTAEAQNKTELRSGRISQIESLFVPAEVDSTQKASYLVTIRDGSDEHVVYYRISTLGHDRSKELAAGTDVMYRISGGNLFVKMPDDKEIKMRVCEVAGPAAKCGNVAFTRHPPQ